MPLSSVLGNIPGAAGWLAGAEEQRTRGAQELGQATSLMGLIQHMQQQQAAQKKMQQDEMLRQAVAQTGGDIPKAIQALVSQGPEGIKLAGVLAEATKDLRPKVQEPFTLAPGARRFGPDGKLIAEAPHTPKEPEASPEIVKLLKMAESLPQGHPMRAAIERRIQVMNKDPTTVIHNAPSVMPVTIQDPKNPNETIIIDGRTKQVLGKGPKLTQVGTDAQKRKVAMEGLGADLQQAEDLLMGQKRDSEGNVTSGNVPTGSGIGSLVDTAASWVGVSPSGAAEADALKVVAGRLIQKIPRFEGPQSDKDTALYKQMAADAGNEKLTRPRRLMALRKMRDLYSRYETGASGKIAGERRALGAGAEGVKFLGFE